MTRHSLEIAEGPPSSTDNWRHSPDPSAVEMSSAPRLSVNAWRNSSDIDVTRPNAAPENPFRDPKGRHQDEADEHTNHPSAAHMHQDHKEHQEDVHPAPRTTIDDDIEAARNLPKEPSPSITALNLNLPYVQPRVVHPQKTHRIFLTSRLLLQVLLFVLALISYLLAYPKVITYRAMLTGNSLGFVIVWAAVIVLAYLGDRGVRMSRYSTQGEQWKKIAKMVVIDVAVVVVWLLVCWGNTGTYSISRIMGMKWTLTDAGLRRYIVNWTNMLISFCKGRHGGGCKESWRSHASSAWEECGCGSWSTEVHAYTNYWAEANHTLGARQFRWALAR